MSKFWIAEALLQPRSASTRVDKSTFGLLERCFSEGLSLPV